ncbi:alpha-ribazole phosphatase [Heliobacterium gestii]|uniref:Alpha-ribazole phosphatase n=1 Tax=Heliomicrobium gestii TaxID=2699 RepID=A0A845LK48_HELGE|nr:alpha-ribazole phosphatase [Heliomicrobium gestii]MBM7867218.1 alpha-ribazole phosphatase [Heliomicrobium gestii]MZP43773.1 alpha-ribazole phosphatase [Heliomicrobium gestii]
MTRVYLIRHGETEWNMARRYQGHSDVQLSEKGREQAQLLVRRLAGEKIDRVFASDLSRAVETARVIAEGHHTEVIVEPRFRECNFGAWEGLTFTEIEKAYPEEMKTWNTAPGKLQLPGGESFAIVQCRAHEAMMELVKKHDNEGVAIVAHGGTIRTLLCAILEVDLDRAWQFRQENTALNIIDFYDCKGIIERINDVTHLIPGAFPTGKSRVE